LRCDWSRHRCSCRHHLCVAIGAGTGAPV